MPLHGLNPESLPTPVAHAYQRLTQETSDHAVLMRALKLLEVSLVHATWVATAAYFAPFHSERSERIDTLLPLLHRPSLGTLADTILALEGCLSEVPGWWMDLNALVPRPNAESSSRKPARQVVLELVALRNKALHRTMGDQGASLIRQPVLDAVWGTMEALGILRLAPPVAVLGCEVRDSMGGPRRRRGPSEKYGVRLVPLAGTGRQPVREVECDQPLDRGLVYQQTPEAGYLLLYPFLQYSSQTGTVLTLHGFDGRRLRLLDEQTGVEQRSELTVEDAAELEPVFAPQVREATRPEADPTPGHEALGVGSQDGPSVSRPKSSAPFADARLSARADRPAGVTLPESNIPEIVGERYRVLEQLGVGAVGTVFRAEHVVSGQVSALKILNYQANENPQLRERFEIEARTLARLEHPGIVALRDFGHDRGRGYIVMEYLPGGSLARRLQIGPSFSVQEACTTLLQIAAAVGYAHSMGVIHRDLKPANLLLTETGQVKVADFGLAHLRDAHPGLTGANTVGTPHYMSPEQILGRSVDERTDVYALGAIFYELVTGVAPFPGESAFAIQEMHLKAPPPSVRNRLPGASMHIERIVARALAKNPAARFSRCDELVQALQSLIQQPFPESAHGSRWGASHVGQAVAPPPSHHGARVGVAESSGSGASLSAGEAWGTQGFQFCRNQVTSFQHLTDLHYRATGHIKATRFSDRAIQDRSRYWQAVMDRAHDPEITYYRLTSVRSRTALRSVLTMVQDLASTSNFHLGLTRAEHPFELVMRDGEEAIFCFHKSDFVVFASLAFDGEADPTAQRIVALYEEMYDGLWNDCDMHINFRQEVSGDPARITAVQERIRAAFPELAD